MMESNTTAFARLVQIMDELREQCPWDRKQTMETLRHLTIEETYELADAILENNMEEIKKELGDILLHIVFYARIASEKKAFDIADVINAVCDKLVARHPHIYGDVKVNNEEDVKRNWEQLKLKEGKASVLDGVPVAMPAIVKAMRIQEKARGAGFDWENKEQVWDKVNEELQEFNVEVNGGNTARIEQEFGDLMFSLINYSRFINVNPEEALERTNKKFIKRFRYLEKAATAAGRKLCEMTLEEMEVYWNEAKSIATGAG